MITVTLRALEPDRHQLDNGLVVIAKEAHTTPAITMHAAVQCGSVHDPPDLPGLAYFLSRVIDRGTTRRTADEIAEEFDTRGVSLSIGVTRHQMSFGCTCLSEDFDAMLELLGDVIMSPALPLQQIATRRGEIITTLRQDEDNPAVVAVERLLELLYPAQHPYGRRVKGRRPSVEAIDQESIRRLHRAQFAPSVLTVVIVGDIDPSRAGDAAARVFGDWRAGSPEKRPIPPPVSREIRTREVIPMMNKTQADIAYGFVAVERSDPDFYAFWIMNNVLGQYALGGRLGDRIRERQGMAYYVFSSLDANVGPGPLIIRAGVNPANVDRAIQSIDEEIHAATSPGFTEQEVAESRQYLIGSLPRNLETNAGIASFLQAAEFFGLGLDYDVRLPGLLQGVDTEDVRAAARRVLSADRAAVVIAGPYSGDRT